MAKTSFESVDAYVAAQPEGVQSILQRVRGAIRRAMPEAEEAISYQIPAYKLAGHPVLYFAAWKAHFSLYPASVPLVAALKAGAQRFGSGRNLTFAQRSSASQCTDPPTRM